MKKVSKLLSVILIIMLVITMATPIVMADGDGDGDGEIVTPSSIDGKSSNVNVNGVTTLGNDIVRVITTIGTVVSVVILVVLGIKYMMGSAEEKAEYKKTLMPYVIGAGLVFAASMIATVVYNIASGINIT